MLLFMLMKWAWLRKEIYTKGINMESVWNNHAYYVQIKWMWLSKEIYTKRTNMSLVWNRHASVDAN